MSRKLLLGSLALGASLWLGHALIGCVGDESAPPPAGDASSDGTTTPDTGTGAKANGVPCGAGNECQTGFCVDGVCCEAKCDGVCEKCNQAPNVGSCTPVPDGQDPDNECPTTPRPDAGAPDPDAAVSDAATEGGEGGSTGPVINEPDGGVTLNDNTCGGKCNGQRACKYPGKETTCGTKFCNTTADQGRATCDGKGHCDLAIEACTAYSCPSGADGGTPGTGCGTTCVGPDDCLGTHYCDGQTSTCKTKFLNGVSCTSGLQCQSGYCAGGVCCNDACNGYPGATCTQPGSVGTCRCSACATGPCKLWYPDKDNDGYGDKNAVFGNTIGVNAIPGCATNPDGGAPVPPAAGYVENNSDCYDVNDSKGPLVHPGQNNPQQTGYGPGNTNFDYNCDGQQTKQYPEDTAGTCGTCGIVNSGGLLVCTEFTTCSATNATNHTQTYHRCGFGGGLGGFCTGQAQNAFHVIRDCGQAGTLYSCGTCQTAGASPPVSVVGNVNGTIQGCY